MWIRNDLKFFIKDKLLIIISVFLVGLAVFAFRDIYQTSYDNVYIQDLYDHSQWTMPINIRSIGDEKLYQLAGYIAVTTGKLFTINPEAPPLAKYLYGISIVLTHNAYTFTLPLFIITSVFVYLLAFEITQNKKRAALTFLLFCSSPLAIAQIKYTMLDLPQLLTLLAHMYMLIRYSKTKYVRFAVLSGIFFGAFMGIKIGFFGFAILIADALYLYKKKSLAAIIQILLVSIVTYIAVFAPYILHEGFVHWFSAEKWVLSFYLSSRAHAFPGLAVIALFFGITKGWNAGDLWRFVEYWTVLWPIMGLMYIHTLWKTFLHRSIITHEYLYAIYITTLLFLSLLAVPFFPRYLLLVLPFLLMFVSKQILSLSTYLKIILVIIIATHYILFLFPQPNREIADMQRLWKSSAYQDMYSYLDAKTKLSISRTQFWRKGKNLEYALQLKSIDVAFGSLPFILPWEDKVSTGVSVHYTTPVGLITYNIPVVLLRQQNEWKLRWNDNLLFPQYSTYQRIRYIPLLSTYSRIFLNNILISEGLSSPFIYVVPKKIKNENMLQLQLFLLTELKKHDVEYLYKANNLPEKEVEIGPVLDNKILDRLKEELDQGIMVHERVRRVFYPNRIDPPEYQQALKILQSKKTVLYPQDGGYIELKHENGRVQKILYKEPAVGHDIIL